MMSSTGFYTGKGDGGDTARLGGQKRIPKSDSSFEVLGTVDEAACAIGIARAVMQTTDLRDILKEVQRHLHQLMAHISATPVMRTQYPGLDSDDVDWLETHIADLETNLPELHNFVLPGDSIAGAACQQARAIVRRAERQLVAFASQEAGILPVNLAYINRLSSLLFVAALVEDQVIT